MKTYDIKNIIFLISVTLSLSGCTIFPRDYRKPVSGPTANVTFLNEEKGFYLRWPFGKKGQEYLLAWGIRAYDEANGCIGQKVIVTSFGAYGVGRTAQVKVKAEKEFAFLVAYDIEHGGDNVKYCSMIASFVPEKNAFYRISFGHDENKADKQCYISAIKIMGQHMIPIKLKMKNPVNPGFGNSFCEKD